jgi:hypothetical protein
MDADSSSLVDFRGTWPPEEQNLIETAVADAQTTGLSTPAGELVPPWVTVRQVVQNRSLYLASWGQEDSGLLGQSAADLADHIREFAEWKTGSAINADRPASEAPGARSLFQLIYESEKTATMSEREVRTLLRKARSKNKGLGITGLLLYAEDRFLQVLEGPETAVLSLYDTIRDDPRHRHVETLHATPVARRTFPDWKMGLEDLTTVSGEAGTSEFLQTGTLREAAEPIDPLIEALQRFNHARSS